MSISKKQALEAKIAELETIAKESLWLPSICLDTYFQEAESLHKQSRADKAALMRAGLSESLLEDLPMRILAAREAQSRWQDARRNRKVAQGRWAAAVPIGRALRTEILRDMRYGYRNQTKLQNRLASITAGRGKAKLIQDLAHLSAIGRSHLKPLTDRGFDASLLDEAAQSSTVLEALRAEAAPDNPVYRERKLIRDRAYTHLKNAVDTIRVVGRYAMWKEPDRARCYSSEHLRRLREGTAV